MNWNEYKQFPNTLLGYLKSQLWNVKMVSSLKYFNRDFLGKYIAAEKAAKEHFKNGTVQRYEKDGVIYMHEYDRVYETDFYKYNSCAYCEFLEVWQEYKRAVDTYNALQAIFAK